MIPVLFKEDSETKRTTLIIRRSLNKWFAKTDSCHDIKLYNNIAQKLTLATKILEADKWWLSTRWDVWCCLRQCFFHYMVNGDRSGHRYQHWKAAFDMIDEMLISKTMRDFPIVIHVGESKHLTEEASTFEFRPQYAAQKPHRLDGEHKLLQLAPINAEESVGTTIFPCKTLAGKCSSFFAAKARFDAKTIETTTHELRDESNLFNMNIKQKLTKHFMNDKWKAMVEESEVELFLIKQLADYLFCGDLLKSCDVLISKKSIKLEDLVGEYLSSN